MKPATGTGTNTTIPVHMVHSLSDSLMARAESLRDISVTIRQYEPLSLDEMRLVGDCLRASRRLTDAWDAVVRHLIETR